MEEAKEATGGAEEEEEEEEKWLLPDLPLPSQLYPQRARAGMCGLWWWRVSNIKTAVKHNLFMLQAWP